VIASSPLVAGSLQRRAFSLTELVVVIGIIGLLIGLTLPAVQRTRSAADRISCQSRLRQIALALHSYHDTSGTFPPGQDSSPFGELDGSARGVSWLAKILPFIDQEPLWQQTERALREDRVPWDNPPHVGLATVIPLYTCPSDGRAAFPQNGPDGTLAAYTSYKGVRGERSGMENGVLPLGRGIRIAAITDGTSQTLMVGERPPSARMDSGWWYASHWSVYSHDFILWAETGKESDECMPPPGGYFVFGPGRPNNQCDMYHFWSLHSGGANFSFADGSVHFISYSISRNLRALASRDGGEVVDVP
jgi:prepilin-type processing-associated H-X9-DG protein/prepilin-type N-terminal cleavage/methylation domain-containing protein